MSDMMMVADCLFIGAFKEKTNMWFPLVRQKAEGKEVKRAGEKNK